jgi:NAD(P)-dependent dehydrogenase (short-subunit alcohol dehydrogenase family)
MRFQVRTPFLAGRNAIVTGASTGLGEAIAMALARSGAVVYLVARRRRLLSTVAARIEQDNGTALPCPADVSEERAVDELRDRILRRSGGVHILVNNAGIHLRKRLEEITFEEWQRVMAVNLTSMFLMCRAFVPGMQSGRFGRIVNLSSVTAWTPAPARSAYAASKAGVLGFTRALALELAPWGVTVNSVSPGTFPTQINAPLLNDPELARQFLARIPLGRLGRPGEVGALVAALCSPAMGFITGTDLLIDGGWRAQ